MTIKYKPKKNLSYYMLRLRFWLDDNPHVVSTSLIVGMLVAIIYGLFNTTASAAPGDPTDFPILAQQYEKGQAWYIPCPAMGQLVTWGTPDGPEGEGMRLALRAAFGTEPANWDEVLMRIRGMVALMEQEGAGNEARRYAQQCFKLGVTGDTSA